MHGYYIFDVLDKSKRFRIVFCSDATPDATSVINALREFGQAYAPADEVLLIAIKDQDVQEALTAAVTDDQFSDRFPELTRYFGPPPVHVLSFNEIGELGEGGSSIPDIGLIARFGMTKIFQDRDGLLQAQDGYHYAKPSGKHSQSFMRVGNIMVSSVEVEFLAFCCLPNVPLSTRRLYCDTGAIFPVAFSIARIRERLLGDCNGLSIESFGSFRGLKTFDFKHAEEALVHISASTSGGLAKAVQAREPLLSARQILTLFYLGEGDAERIVCDLRSDDSISLKGFSTFRSYGSKGKCELCKRGWNTIGLEGDQFLPGESPTVAVIIGMSDVPGQWLSKFVELVHKFPIIRTNFTDSDDDRDQPFQIYLDLERLFSNDVLNRPGSLGEKLDWLVGQNAPYTTRRIIHLPDAGSTQLANAIRDRISSDFRSSIQVVPSDEVISDLSNNELDSGTTIVVAASVSSGRGLHGIAQALRQAQSNRQLHYFVGVTRCPSSDRLREMRSNLSHGKTPHGFWSLETIHIPLSTFAGVVR